MTCDVIAFANEGVSGLTPYEPGKPIEDLQRELGLSEIIKLASNESPLGPAPGALDAARSALLDVARYPDGNGFELKARLAGMLNVAAAQITLGNGSNDVLEFVARAFAGPGAEIVYSEHAFVVYPISARLVGAKGIAVPARNFGHDLDAMAQAITANTRVVYIANPNNPTGTWVDADALAAFVRALPDHVVIVVDEAYREYVDDKAYPDCVQWLDESPNLVVTRTFSKAYGLAGLRVGYAVCHPLIADLMNRVRQPFNVNSVALAAAHAALADDDHLNRAIALNDKGLSYLEGELQRLELPYIPSIGNFISFELPCDALPVYHALLREGVIVRPIGAYGMPRHLRVSVGLDDENQRFVQALERVLAGGVNDHD